MKLVNYGPGEITDRLTILALKILVGTEKGRPVDHFKTEQAALLAQVRSRTLNGVWFEQVLELAAVNGQLWVAEDDLRAYRGSALTTPKVAMQTIEDVPKLMAVCELAFRIQKLNDTRAELVQRINEAAGDSGRNEKI